MGEGIVASPFLERQYSMSQSSDYSPENPYLGPSTINFGKKPNILLNSNVPGQEYVGVLLSSIPLGREGNTKLVGAEITG